MKKAPLVATLVGGFLALQAHASTVYNLDNANFSGYTPPYGTVTVNLDGLGTTATIQFSAASGFLFVGASSVAVNVHASTFNLVSGSVTGMNLSGTSSGQVDGRGSFNLILDAPNANPSNRTPGVTFEIFNAAGWSSDATVLTANSLGNSVGAHVYLTTGTLQGNTQYVGGGSTNSTSVPDGGATLLLLGSALTGLALIRPRFAK